MLQTRVAEYRQYLRAQAQSREDEELLAAKFVGRGPSGAPLALAPERDDAGLGADPARNNAFMYAADDAKGLKCPLGAHARRSYARDAKITGVARVGQRRHLLRHAGRDRSAGRADRRNRRLHRPAEADPPARGRAATVRRQPRRRVLLHARPAGAALARRPRHVGRASRRDHFGRARTGRDAPPAPTPPQSPPAGLRRGPRTAARRVRCKGAVRQRGRGARDRAHERRARATCQHDAVSLRHLRRLASHIECSVTVWRALRATRSATSSPTSSSSASDGAGRQPTRGHPHRDAGERDAARAVLDRQPARPRPDAEAAARADLAWDVVGDGAHSTRLRHAGVSSRHAAGVIKPRVRSVSVRRRPRAVLPQGGCQPRTPPLPPRPAYARRASRRCCRRGT